MAKKLHPKQTNPNSLANLMRGNPNTPFKDKKVASECGKKGNVVKAEQNNLKNDMRKYFSDNPDKYRLFYEAIIEKAMQGDARAFELVRDTIGERPHDTLDVASDNKIEFVVNGLEVYAD